MCPSSSNGASASETEMRAALLLGIEVATVVPSSTLPEPGRGAGRRRGGPRRARSYRRRRARPGRRCGSWPSGRSSPEPPGEMSIRHSERRSLGTVSRDGPGRRYRGFGSSRSRARARDATGTQDFPGRISQETSCSTDAGAAVSSRASDPSATGCDASASAPMRSRSSGCSARPATAVLIAIGPPRLGRGRGHRRGRQRPARRRDRPRERPGSPRGAFFDSVADRASDALLLGGCAWWLAGESPHLAVLAFAVRRCSMIISYERARAEALGINAPRRPDGAGRAVRLPQHRPGVRHPRAGAVGHARAHRVHRRAIASAASTSRRTGRSGRTRPPGATTANGPRRRCASRSTEPEPALKQWWATRRVDGSASRRHRVPRRSRRP